MVPIYTKPNTQKKRRRKKPGARIGQQGVRRERPARIDERETHRLKSCPHCQGQLQRCARSRTRVIEDIPEQIKPVVTEHTFHRDFSPDKHRSRVHRLDKRLTELAGEEPIDGDARRLTKRLRKHVDHMFRFLDHDDVPFDDNFAERQIRPAVILRKNSQSNRSDQGAVTQAVLMSVYRTLRLRGIKPDQNHHPRAQDLPEDRATTPTTKTKRCRRLKSYPSRPGPKPTEPTSPPLRPSLPHPGRARSLQWAGTVSLLRR